MRSPFPGRKVGPKNSVSALMSKTGKCRGRDWEASLAIFSKTLPHPTFLPRNFQVSPDIRGRLLVQNTGAASENTICIHHKPRSTLFFFRSSRYLLSPLGSLQPEDRGRVRIIRFKGPPHCVSFDFFLQVSQWRRCQSRLEHRAKRAQKGRFFLSRAPRRWMIHGCL